MLRFFRQLLYWVSSMKQYSLITINESDFGIASGSRDKAWVIGEISLSCELTYVYNIRSVCCLIYRQVNVFAIYGQLGCFVRHAFPPIVTAVPIRISQTLQADFFLFSVCVALLNKLCQGEQVIRAQPMRQILVDEPEVHFLSKLVLAAR